MGWTIKEMKLRGKKAFDNNYWKAVAIAFIMALVAGGVSGFNGGGSSRMSSLFESNHSNYSNSSTDTGSGLIGEVEEDEERSDSEEKTELVLDTQSPETFKESMNNMSTTDKVVLGGVMFALFTLVFLLIFTFAMLINVFLYNPLEMGCCRFFFRNLEEPAKISNLVYAFDQNYKNVIKILFFRDLYIIGWSLLFIIPGWIKKYEYRMVTYLLAEDPDMSKEDAFRISKEMMNGNKWKAFLLDLSFVGWAILSLFTCGLLSILFVSPYHYSTNAALYERLRYENEVAE